MAIAVVLILVAAMLIMCASLLTYVTFEKQMTRRTAAIAELKQSTDTLLGYAASQIASNPSLAPSASRASAVVLPPADLFQSESNALTLEYAAGRELVMSRLSRLTDPTSKLVKKFYIDPAATINRNDTLRGQMVYRDLCFIAARSAVSVPGTGTSVREHGVMILERRLVHVFNYLAFFDVSKFRITNPGSNIVLDGPIQANQGIFFESSKHPSTVQMQSTVHSPGTLVFSGSTLAGKFMITDGTTTALGAPTMVDMLKPGTSVLRQTSDDIDGSGKIIGSTFKNFMLNNTKGMLATGESGESTVELDGLNYVDDTASATPAAFKVVNNRRIDPPNPALRSSTDPAYADARVAETAKTAYQAGLYTYVETDGSATVFTSQAAAESYKGAGDKATWKTLNSGLMLAPAETSAFIAMPYVERYNTGGADYTSTSKNTDLARGAMFDSQQKATVAAVDVDLGALALKINSGSLKLANGTSLATTGVTGWNGVLYVDVQNPAKRPQAPVKDKATGYYVSKKQAVDGSGVPIPNTYITAPDPAATAETAIRADLPSLNITKTAQAWDSGSAVTDSTGLTAVRIKNATTVPSAKVGDPGFTLATNTATYTVGSVNADGKLATGTTSLQDDQSSSTSVTTKVPMGIFSDKNVVLSADFANPAYDLALYVPKPSSYPPGMNSTNWPFTGPKGTTLNGNGKTNGHYQYQGAPSSGSVMELNCGFIIGDDDSSNKGIHTMLSYLQPFSTTNDTLRMRGSLIGIYKARYFTAPAGSFNDYYIAPVRTFGYSSLFKNGSMPPAAPTISNFRRMRQFVVTEADYNQLKAVNGKSADSWLAVLGGKY